MSDGASGSGTTTAQAVPAVGTSAVDRDLGSGAWNTPIARTENCTQRYGFERKDYLCRYPRLAEETKRITLGPMPVEQFLNAFLPVAESAMQGMPPPANAFSGIGSIKNESDIYLPLAKALNADNTNPDAPRAARCPGFSFRITADHPDLSNGKICSTKPDIVCYADRHLSVTDATGDDALVARANMGFAATCIEIKPTRANDHYLDPPKGAERATHTFPLGNAGHPLSGKYLEGLKTFGQNSAYAVELCARQHRCFCFTVSVSGRTARLIRWDRSGSIVTVAFDYVEKPELLCAFFWRFGKVSDTARGYDLTVEPASDAEAALFSSTIKAHLLTQIAVAADDAVEQYQEIHYQAGFVAAICLPTDQGGTGSRRLLISRPITVPLSVSGSCTRTYWAVEDVGTPDKPKHRVVLLKDTWRMAGDNNEPEGDVIRHLHGVGVRNIPSVLYDWDVQAVDAPVMEKEGKRKGKQREHTFVQKTATQDFLECAWVCDGSTLGARVVPRVHYRIVMDVAGLDLLTLSGTHELLHGAYHVFQALTDACKHANRLHSDIHPGNIILFRVPNDPDCTPSTRRGYLIDWDHSRLLTRKTTLRYHPSLQWQFASVALLTRIPENKPHQLEDDMESILYVVLYCALLRLRHDLSPEKLVRRLNLLFDLYLETDDGAVGGNEKNTSKSTRRHTKHISWGSPPLKEWIDTVYEYLEPIAQAPADRVGKWTAEDLDKFWRGFLETNPSLPRTDVINHITLHLDTVHRNAPRSVQGTPNQPTTTAGSKRSLPDVINAQANKRQKILHINAAPSDPISASVVDRDLAQSLATSARASTPVVDPSQKYAPGPTLPTNVTANVQAGAGPSQQARTKAATSRKADSKAVGGAAPKKRTRRTAGSGPGKARPSVSGNDGIWHHYQPPTS